MIRSYKAVPCVEISPSYRSECGRLDSGEGTQRQRRLLLPAETHQASRKGAAPPIRQHAVEKYHYLYTLTLANTHIFTATNISSRELEPSLLAPHKAFTAHKDLCIEEDDLSVFFFLFLESCDDSQAPSICLWAAWHHSAFEKLLSLFFLRIICFITTDSNVAHHPATSGAVCFKSGTLHSWVSVDGHM